jgi:hypothetical protein
MTNINSALSTGIRRFLPAALVAVAAMLGGGAFGSPQTAYAEPNTTGSQASYDECVARGSNKRLCCSLASGQWEETRYYDKDGNYLYSSYSCKGLAMQHPLPSTATPGTVIQTFEPAPAPLKSR